MNELKDSNIEYRSSLRGISDYSFRSFNLWKKLLSDIQLKKLSGSALK